MNVVWAYKNLGGNPFLTSSEENLSFSPITWTLAKASTFSWKLYAPGVKRILYADPDIYEFLKITGLISNWDSVICVESFDEYNDFWANPKAYAQVRQSEPFWIADLDFILLDDLNKWFSPDKYWVFGRIDRLGGEYNGNEKDFEKTKAFFNLICTEFPEVSQLVDLRNMCNGGSVFYADPRIGTIVGHVLQGIQTYSYRVIQPWCKNRGIEIPEITLGSGAIEEEGLIGKLLNTLNMPLGDLMQVTEDGYVQHFWSTLKYDVDSVDKKLKPWFNFKEELKKTVTCFKRCRKQFLQQIV